MHSQFPQPDDWMSTEMIRAEREFDAAAEEAHQALADARQFRERMQANDEEQDKADAAMWRDYAGRDDTAPQWRRVAERIENGEFTWLDIARRTVIDDPDVKAAMIEADRTARQHSREKPDDETDPAEQV
jgi:hypothetical protein